MTRVSLFLIASALVWGCGGDGSALDAGSDSGAADSGGEDTATGCVAAPSEVVSFTTEDGVSLAADLRLASRESSPWAAVLLHMVPPSNDRSNYPSAFIEALASRGISVLNVDRRGAGASGGVAREAYEGPNGWLDADAAITFLEAHRCGFSASRIVLVGASNGTTSVLDHRLTAAASHRAAAMVFLTAGAYTENQHSIADARAELERTPILWVHSSAESAFSASFMADAPSSWTFRAYPAGDHGTRMFSAVPASIEDVAGWMAGQAEAR